MKLVVSRERLTRGLARIQGVLSRKATLPILSNVLLEARADGALRIAATDLDVTFDGQIEARVEEAGRITVDGKKIYDICRSLPGEEISLSVDDQQRIQLKCRSSDFVLNGLSATDYPTLPDGSAVELVPVNGDAFKELIERTSFSVATDESRPNLTGIFFQCAAGSRIRLVSTDGHRLSKGERDASRDDAEIPERDGVIVPRKGITEIKRMLDEAGAEVLFGFLDNNFVLETPEVRLFVRLIDAAFPDYHQVIPKGTERKVILDRVSFLQSLKRIAILASERTHGVRIELSSGQMTLGSDNPDLGRAREDITPESYDGSELTIAFNSRYLIDILSTLKAEKVEMHLNEALSPGIIREHENEDYLFVVMPMRL